MSARRCSGPPFTSRAHSMPMPAEAAATSAGSYGQPNHTAASAGGINTSAETMRSVRTFASARANGGAVAAIAAVEVAHGLFEIALGEIGPQRRREHQLGVSGLPEQEIADALLAAGADEQVGIGNAGGQQPRRERILIDGIGRELSGRHILSQAPRRER